MDKIYVHKDRTIDVHLKLIPEKWQAKILKGKAEIERFNAINELRCCDHLKSYKLYCYTRKNCNIIRAVLEKDKHKTKVFDVRVYSL